MDELSRNSRMRALGEIAQGFNGELFNLCFFEEIKSMAEHLMGVCSRPKVAVQLTNINTANRPVNIDGQDLLNKHFVMLPTSKLEDNPFTWDRPEVIKLPKFPAKCLDNLSIISFPEEAFYVMSETLNKGHNLFTDVDFPGTPRYFVDPSHMLIKKQALSIKADAYVLESKSLTAKFKQLTAANPKLKKILLPVYYFYQYEQNFQLIGYVKYEIFGKQDEFFKLEFKHYPLKFLHLNDIVSQHKAQIAPRLEKVIESLPRYSHNYYFSILKMYNVVPLLKKRFKFMFGFSVAALD